MSKFAKFCRELDEADEATPADLERWQRTAAGFRRNLEASDEVTDPAFLVALDAARADALVDDDDISRERLAAMEQNRVTKLQPRYGAAMRARVTAALAKLDGLTAVAAPAPEETIVVEEAPVYVSAPRAVEEGVSLSVLGGDAATRALAEAARTSRAAERAAAARASRDAPRGPEALRRALETLNTTATVALGAILKAIVERPDDERRRKLRCANEAFRRDLGDDARMALYAAGFVLVTRENRDDDMLVMTEPDPSVHLDAWTTWFDTLKECKTTLEAHLAPPSVVST